MVMFGFDMGEVVRLGDCLEQMSALPDKCADLVLCDLPYGTTRNKWDCQIPLDALWGHYRRIVKDRGAVLLFAQPPFSGVLMASNPEMFKYEWVWVKSRATGFLNANFAPLKGHESILVFSKSSAAQVADREKAMAYFPQFRSGKPYVARQGRFSDNYDKKNRQEGCLTVNDGSRYYPIDVLEFKCEGGLHPTQKPVDLLRYLIRTYAPEGGLVVDNCAGSGSTAVAAIREGRGFWCCEKDEKYYEIALRRIMEELYESGQRT